MNNDFTELTQSYLSICNILEPNIELIKKDPVFSNEIIKCQATINDLIIQIQNINFKIQTLQHDTENEHEHEDINKPTETDKIVDKTIQDMLPLFMLHMMNNDPNSIINKPTENTTQTHTKTLPPETISKMLSLAKTLFNLPVTPTNTSVSSNISNSVDDVD
jgi:hypothetical protein